MQDHLQLLQTVQDLEARHDEALAQLAALEEQIGQVLREWAAADPAPSDQRAA